MSRYNLQPAEKPTIYFIGVTTGSSAILKVFPEWAKYLELGDCQIKGIDCKLHDDPEVYREVVSFIKQDPLSRGALVTTHKIDLLKAARVMFEKLDHYAELMGEISCIYKQDGCLAGSAKDPITSGLSLRAIVPDSYWNETGAEIFVLGAGGSSIALTSFLMENCPPESRPAKIYVSNRSGGRLEEMREIHHQINPGIPVEYVATPHPEDNDRIMARLKRGSLVVNATGLGKDAPGSPLSSHAEFPEDGIAWDFNYRGNLVFLDQARAQQQRRNLRVEDGWIYFIHGWTRVVAEVFCVDIPTSGPRFDDISRIAASVR